MDEQRIDAVAKTLADGATRRRVVGGAFGAMLAAVGLAEVGAGGKGKAKGKDKDKDKQDKGNGQGGNGGGGEKCYVCHCRGQGQSRNCTTLHIGCRAVDKHLENHEEDVRGRCTSDGDA